MNSMTMRQFTRPAKKDSLKSQNLMSSWIPPSETNRKKLWRILPWSFSKCLPAWIWKEAFQHCFKCSGILWILALTFKIGLLVIETKSQPSRDASGKVLMSIVLRCSRPIRQTVACAALSMHWKQRKYTETLNSQEVLTPFKNKMFLIPSNILPHCLLVLKQEKSLHQKQVINLNSDIGNHLCISLFRQESGPDSHHRRPLRYSLS